MPPFAAQYDRKEASQQHEHNPITARPPDPVPAEDIKPLLETYVQEIHNCCEAGIAAGTAKRHTHYDTAPRPIGAGSFLIRTLSAINL